MNCTALLDDMIVESKRDLSSDWVLSYLGFAGIVLGLVGGIWAVSGNGAQLLTAVASAFTALSSAPLFAKASKRRSDLRKLNRMKLIVSQSRPDDPAVKSIEQFLLGKLTTIGD